MGETTVLTKATPRSRSLRSTVPASIVRLLGLKEGDRLLWEVKAEGNDLIIIVKPQREGEP
ncbi:MAG: AbrB/MazE/SpoVT family DNA-binding domain-containing protein [Sulfolobales archaeon]